MPDYNLGTARGRIVIETGGAVANLKRVEGAHRRTISGIRQQSYELRRAGTAFLAVSAAMLGAVGTAIKAAAGFEREISRFAAVTGASRKQIDQVREAALTLGTNTTIGATEAAKAIVELGKAGLRTKDIVQGTAEATILLARAGELPLAEAALVTANAMKTFNLSARDSIHIADVLAGAANASTVEVSDLATSMRFVGPAAIATKTSLEDVSTALAIFGNRGLRGSIAGTALRGMMVRLNGPTKKAHELMVDLGIITKKGGNEFFTAKGKMKGLADIAQILQDHTKNLTQEQKINTFYTLFGQRAMSAGIILADQGAAGFNKMAKAIGTVTAQQVSAKKLDNLSGSILKLKAVWQTTLIRAGEPFQKLMKRVVDRITGALKWFNNLSDGMRKWIVIGIAAVGMLTGLLGAFLIFASIVKRFQEAVETMRLLAAESRILGVGFRALGGIWRAFSALFLSNPLGIIILVLIAIGVALFILYKKVAPVRRFFDRLWQTIQRVWDTILAFFKAIPGAVTRFIGRAVAWLKRNWDILAAIFLGPIGVAILIVKRFGPQILAALKAGFNAVVGFFKNLPRYLAQLLLLGLKLLVAAVVFSMIVLFVVWIRILKLQVRLIIAFFRNLPGWLVTAFKAGLHFFFAVGRAIIVGLYRGIRGAIHLVFRFFANLPGWILNFTVGFFKLLLHVGHLLIRGFVKGIRAAALGIWRFLGSLPGKILSYVSGIKEWLLNAGIDLIKGLIKGIGRGAQAIAGALIDGIKSGIKHALGFLGIHSPSRLFEGYGVNVMEGFVKGISGHRRQVKKELASFASLVARTPMKPITAQVNASVGRAATATRVPQEVLAIRQREAHAHPIKGATIAGKLAWDGGPHAVIRGVVTDEIDEREDFAASRQRQGRMTVIR